MKQSVTIQTRRGAPRYFTRVSQVPAEVEAPTGVVNDALGRPLHDLRISVTDRCNFRCVYCMPKEIFDRDFEFLSKKMLLTFDEIIRIARISAAHGVEKLRLTGGEPLLRVGIEDLIAQLRELRTPEGRPLDLALTTNGSALAHKAHALKDAGLNRVSTPWSVEIIEHYIAMGANISFEVTPHNLILASEDAMLKGPSLKVVPPLRVPATVRGLAQMLAEWRIDMIATDHAPHTPEEKTRSTTIWATPGGFAGLETLLQALMALVGRGRLQEIARIASARPAARFGLGTRKGRIEEGFDADLVVVDPDATPGAPARFHTRAAATPFDAQHLKGGVILTIVGGSVAYRDGVIVGEPRGQVIEPDWQKQ